MVTLQSYTNYELESGLNGREVGDPDTETITDITVLLWPCISYRARVPSFQNSVTLMLLRCDWLRKTML